jgi:hypothetical protein
MGTSVGFDDEIMGLKPPLSISFSSKDRTLKANVSVADMIYNKK